MIKGYKNTNTCMQAYTCLCHKCVYVMIVHRLLGGRHQPLCVDIDRFITRTGEISFSVIKPLVQLVFQCKISFILN